MIPEKAMAEEAMVAEETPPESCFSEETGSVPEECAPDLTAELPSEEISGEKSPAAVSAQDGGDSAPPAEAESSDPDLSPADELNALREELRTLRAEIAQKEAFYAKADREYAEFRALYPDTDPQALPDSVWEEVRCGTPLAAAFALSERRRMLALAVAEESNRQNKARSPGGLQGGAEDAFSLAEVRAMSPSEIRAHYDKVMRSLQKWH